MAGPREIDIAEVLVPAGNSTPVQANLPSNVLSLDIQITSSDWASLSGNVDFLFEVLIGSTWQTALQSSGNQLGFLSPKGNGLPHFTIGAAWLGPGTKIRLTVTPTTPVHMGLVVIAG